MKKNWYGTRILSLTIILIFFLIYYKLFTGSEIFTHDSIIWYGRFHYYVDSITKGTIPFWDPYIITGIPFYHNINVAGLLVPWILIPIFLVKVLGVNILSVFIYFNILNLIIFIVGAFYLLKFITKCNISASVSALVLLLAVTPPFFRQVGCVDLICLTPFTIYFSLSFFENIKNLSKYKYLLYFIIVFGISMNTIIPVYFLFNLFVFIITLFILKIVKLNELIKLAYDKKFMLFLFVSFFILLLMLVPLFTLYKDSGISGEIFPAVRILQKNEGQFKKIVASDINESVLSEKFADNLGVYNSYGNILNLIYPNMYKSYFGPSNLFTAFFKRNDYIAETFMYIGIIPLIFAIIGFIYSKSRYKYLALIMLIIIFINMFSFYGVHNRPPNFLQKFFNIIFPPLKMIEVREVFSTFFLLYLVILSSLGFKLFFNGNLPKWITVGDGYKSKLIYILIFLFIFVDLFIYNIRMKPLVLQKNILSKIISERQKEHLNYKFEYFRIPFVDNLFVLGEPLAYGETILKIKGAISRGNNHHMFTTKRYYDYLTHVPLENQSILSGIVYPVVRFYNEDRVKVFQDKKSLLENLAREKPDVLQKCLFIEDEKNGIFKNVEKLKKLSMYEDVLFLKKDNIINFYVNFFKKEKEKLMKIRNNVDRYLNTSEYSIDVKEFIPNKVVVTVYNKLNGYLYYNDGYSKYWKAYDNGKEIPIKIANYNFKAVYLEKGNHVVSFVYDPVHYKLSLIMYYLGLLFSIILIVFLWYRKV